MIIEKIKFPKTSSNFFHKLEKKEFIFKDRANKSAQFVFFIGENGSGKTTLLYWLWKIHDLCWTIENDDKNICGKYKIWKYLCSAQKLQHNIDKEFSNDILLKCSIANKNFNLRIIKRNNSYDNLSDFQNNFSDYFTMQCLLSEELDTLIKEHNYQPLVFYHFFTVSDYLINNQKIEIQNEILDLNNESWKDIRSYRNLFFKGYIKEPPHILKTTFKKINYMIEKYCGYQFAISKMNGISRLIYSKVEFGKENKYFFSTMSSGEHHLLFLFYKICERIIKFKLDKIFLFIDEIENSLSPKKQEKILKDLDDLLKLNNIEKQIFVATHSPFVLKNFLNRDDTAIISVETSENILKSKTKKLLLNKNNNVSYDEISYLYYDIITSSYYISLYEELKNKVGRESYKKMDDWLKKNKDKINEIIKEKKLDKNNFVEIEKIKCINHNKLNNDGEINEKCVKDKDWTISTNLTRLRHMFAHGWTKEKNFLFYKKHPEQFKNNNDDEIAKTNEFYSFFKDESITNEEIESLLKKYIELMRTILINWEK